MNHHSKHLDFLAPDPGWIDPPKNRLEVPLIDERGFLLRNVSRVFKVLTKRDIPNVFLTLIKKPGLFWPWALFASRLMPFGSLPSKSREKIILRVAWKTRCRYEWAAHVEIAHLVGVPDSEIIGLSVEFDAIGSKSRNSFSSISDTDKLLYRVCDNTLENLSLNQNDWGRLTQTYTDAQIVELFILIGHYEMLAKFLVNTGVRVEPEGEAKLFNFYKRLQNSNLVDFIDPPSKDKSKPYASKNLKETI